MENNAVLTIISTQHIVDENLVFREKEITHNINAAGQFVHCVYSLDSILFHSVDSRRDKFCSALQ